MHERVHDGVTERGLAQRRGDLALDHLASEIVERIFTLRPSGVARGVALERRPKVAATVTQHHDRACRRIDQRRARVGLHRGIISRERERGAQVEAVARGGRAHGGEY